MQSIPKTTQSSILVGQWLDWLKNNLGTSAHTHTAYKQDITQFITFLQNHLAAHPTLQELENLSVTDFRSWLSMRSQTGYNHRSTRRAISALKNFFRFIKSTYGVENKAYVQISSPKLNKMLPKNLSISQTQQLIDEVAQLSDCAWVGQRDKAIFMLLYGAGLRISEALTITYEQYHADKTCLRVIGKRNKERIVPLLTPVKQEIDYYLDLCPFGFSPNSPIFLGIKGKVLNPGIVQKQMRTFRTLYGLGENATPHSLRHSFATDMLSATKNLRAVQDLLGHVNLSSTQIYTQLDNKDLLEIYQDSHPRAHKPPATAKTR